MAKKQKGPDCVPASAEHSSIARKRLMVTAGVLAGITSVWWGAQKLFEGNGPNKAGTDRMENTRSKGISAEEFFRAFPDQIPGAANVEKFPVPGAKRCIVHLRDSHRVDHFLRHYEKKLLQFDEKERKELEPIMEELHKEAARIAGVAAEADRDALKILMHLIEHCSVQEVYMEGITQSSQEPYDSFHALMYRMAAMEEKFSSLTGKFPDNALQRKKIEESLQEVERSRTKVMTSMHRELRGFGELFLQKKILIRAGDDEDTLNTAMQVYLHGTDQNLKNKVDDLREEQFLIKASQIPHPFAVVRFGSGHKWWNNVQEWNKNIPDMRYSLIEVTPAAVDRHDKEGMQK